MSDFNIFCYNGTYDVCYCISIKKFCKDFSLLSVLISKIILHVSYELFRRFYSIFRLKGVQ